jgi:hypothetical protein
VTLVAGGEDAAWMGSSESDARYKRSAVRVPYPSTAVDGYEALFEIGTLIQEAEQESPAVVFALIVDHARAARRRSELDRAR